MSLMPSGLKKEFPFDILNYFEERDKENRKMSEWTVEGTLVVCGSYSEELEEVSVSDVKRIAKKCNIKRFTVETAEGELLDTGDFPYSNGKVIIKGYNEPKVSG